MNSRTMIYCFLVVSIFVGGIAGQTESNVPSRVHFLRIKDFNGDPNCFHLSLAKTNDSTFIGYRRWNPPTGCGVSDLFILVNHPNNSFESYKVNEDGSRGALICRVAHEDRKVAGNIVKVTRDARCDYGDGAPFETFCVSRKAICELTESDQKDLERLCPENEFTTVRCDQFKCNRKR